MPTPNPIFRLTSPYGKQVDDGKEQARVQCQIPLRAYINFFKGTLLACRGAQYNIITSLLQPLIQTCHEAQIPTTYDPDNEQRVAEILARVNFHDLDSIKRDSYAAGFAAGVESCCGKDTLARGTSGKPDRSKPGRAKSGRAKGVHQGNPDNGSLPTDTTGGTQG